MSRSSSPAPARRALPLAFPLLCVLAFALAGTLRAAPEPAPSPDTSSPAAAANPAPAATATPPAGAAVAGKPSFYSPRVVLWAGRNAVIPFRTTQATDEDHFYALNTSDASLLEILRPPTVLGGQTRGFLRVRPLRLGQERLTLGGDAVLDVEVRADPVGAALAQVDAESPRPRLVSPSPEAVVWGDFAVGVDVFDPGTASDAPAPVVHLRLPNGRLLDPVASTGLEAGPVRHYQFTVSGDDLPTGPATLVAVSTPAGFKRGRPFGQETRLLAGR